MFAGPRIETRTHVALCRFKELDNVADIAGWNFSGLFEGERDK